MQPLLRSLAFVALSAACAHAELAASFESGAAKDVRADRLPALLVKAGESPTPFLPAGPFTTTWTGKLVLAERYRLSFSFEGEGSATLTIDGKETLKEEGTLGATASERVRLNRGEHEISITYKSKADGSGRFRLFWDETSFPKQSVPPGVFIGEVPSDPVRHGRQLFAENNCSKCHLGESVVVTLPEAMELPPLLFNTGSRLNEEWVAHWIADPSSLKPDTRMPAMVDGSTAEGKQTAADIAAWLMSLSPTPAGPAPDAALAQKGGEHFHRFGCAACHTLPDQPSLADSQGRIPLSNVALKFQPGALPAFLKKPNLNYTHIGMPDFGLSDAEANELAAFLLAGSKKVDRKLPAFPKGDAKRGAALADSHYCAACHAGTGGPAYVQIPKLDGLFKKDWAAKGCVSATHGAKEPKLALNDEEKAALVAFSKKGPDSLQRHVPAEYAAYKLKALRCTSCHAIDGKPSLLDSVHVETKPLVAHVKGENEKLDQTRPQLTYIGEMLHSAYIESMIAGKETPRPRPWLDMRMPAFENFAPGLAEGFARIHGVEPGKAEDPKPDAELAKIGKLLTGAEGFACTICHANGDQKATAAFEVEGVNFALSHRRLRHEWFMRWMDNPPSITPSTKMPRFSEDGKSQRTDVLDGDAAKQFEAIWQYIQKPQ